MWLTTPCSFEKKGSQPIFLYLDVKHSIQRFRHLHPKKMVPMHRSWSTPHANPMPRPWPAPLPLAEFAAQSPRQSLARPPGLICPTVSLRPRSGKIHQRNYIMILCSCDLNNAKAAIQRMKLVARNLVARNLGSPQKRGPQRLVLLDSWWIGLYLDRENGKIKLKLTNINKETWVVFQKFPDFIQKKKTVCLKPKARGLRLLVPSPDRIAVKRHVVLRGPNQ